MDTVTGESDTRDSCSASVRMYVNGPPTAILDVTSTCRDCTFDGSGSTDDNGIVSYAFVAEFAAPSSHTALIQPFIQYILHF